MKRGFLCDHQWAPRLRSPRMGLSVNPTKAGTVSTQRVYWLCHQYLSDSIFKARQVCPLGGWPYLMLQLKEKMLGCDLPKGSRIGRKLLWFQYHHLHLFLARKEQTLMGFITQRPGLETAHCLYRDNIWRSPPSSASKQKLSQGQPSLQGILWIKKKKPTILKKTILQLGSPLLEAPPARKALGFSQLSSCCFAGR